MKYSAYIHIRVSLLALSNVHFEKIRVDYLREPEIHHLVKELVNQCKILPDLLLSEFPIEIAFAKFNH